MADDPNVQVPIDVAFETPQDLEYEDYLNRVNTIEAALGGALLEELERVCDGCTNVVPFRQQGLAFKCNECDSHYDLCVECQQGHKLDRCPFGWGCGLFTDES